jgi:branched-chain amino acid transport system substrate-binding protein
MTAMALACLGAAVALAACGSGSGTSASPDKAGNAAFKLKVGNIVPLTGDLSPFGPPGSKAARLAIEQVQAALQGTGIEVSIEDQDEQTNPQAAVSAARKLVSDGATCLAGAWASGDTIPVAQSVASRQGIPQISPASTSAKISSLDTNGYLFRTAPSDTLQAPALARVVAKAVGAGKTISLAARNDAYGSGFIEQVKTSLQALGEKTTGPVLYDPNAASYDSEATKIVAGNPAAYVIIDFPETYAKVGAALLRTGKFDAKKLFTADGLANGTIPQGVPAAALDGARGTRPGAPKSGTAAIAFGKLYASSPGAKVRNTFDAQNFDATMLCVLAAVAAGSSDGPAIRDHMQAVSGPPGTKYTFEQLPQAIKDLRAGKDIDYEGASGPVDFDAHGDPSAAIYENYAYKGGKLVVTGQFLAHASG